MIELFDDKSGGLHLKMGQYQECQKHTNEAIEIRKNNLPKITLRCEDYMVLGQLNEVLGDNENALKNYLKAKKSYMNRRE